MSRKVNVQFQVNSMAIMRSTLTEMGMEFSEKNNAISVKRSYHPITINGDTGEISYDSDNEREVKLIKQNYATNFYMDRAIREGAQLVKTVVGNKVHLTQR